MTALFGSIQKFGRNNDVDAAEDIWGAGGNYPWPASALATTIEGGAQDVITTGTGAWTVSVQGLDSDYLLIDENVTMNGATPVTLTKQYLRIFRARVLTAGSDGTNNGNILIKHASTTIGQITAGIGQTLMAIYTIPANYSHGIWVSWYAALVNNVSAGATMAFQTRPFGGAWNTRWVGGCSNGQDLARTFETARRGGRVALGNNIIYAKTDIRVRAIAVTTVNLDIVSGFELELQP